jgi:hypothetical protein
MARTAACLCVVLTLDGAATFFGAALRATAFGAAFFVFTAVRDLAAIFLAALGLATFLADVLAAVALWALGLEDDFALTARFALFAGFAFERDVDRLNPFVRLLLMCGSQKAARLKRQPWNRAELTIDGPLYQRAQVFAGALLTENPD